MRERVAPFNKQRLDVTSERVQSRRSEKDLKSHIEQVEPLVVRRSDAVARKEKQIPPTWLGARRKLVV